MRGHHVAVRTPSRAEALDSYVGKLDFRVVAEWGYGTRNWPIWALLADDSIYLEILNGGDTLGLQSHGLRLYMGAVPGV
jgi:catechol 2,3-dioxygenase-like lactoylglutathione lyase family enzyme